MTSSPTIPGAAPPVHCWRIHLGAHKTATTHLQQTLVAIRPDLAGRGVDAIPNEVFRPVALRHLSRRNWRVWTGGAPMRRDLAAAIAPLRLGPDVVLISEENLLGHMDSAVRLPIYSGLDWRLRALSSLGRGAQVELFLSIRQMDRFLLSSYAQTLRHFAPERPFEALRPELVAHPPRWTDITARIRRAMPLARLTIWCYEDYAANTAAITARLCGTDPGPLPDLPPPAITMTPSAQAVLASEALDPALSAARRIEEVEKLFASAPAGPDAPPFRPFSATETARFAEAYAADCAAFRAEGCLLEF